MTAPRTVDEYIAAAPAAAQPQLKAMRQAIIAGAPAAEERISYGMPYYHLNGRLTYFALHGRHIGLYAFSAADVAGTALERYAAAKSTLRFPLHEDLPVGDITALVRRRAGPPRSQARRSP